MTDKHKTKRMSVWIDQETLDYLENDFLKDDSNRILGAKVRKGTAVSIALEMLFRATETKSIEQIYQELLLNSGDC